MKTAISTLALMAAIACGGGASGTTEPQAVPTHSPTESAPQAFDDLTITMQLDSHEVSAGGEIGTEVVIKNETDRGVTDPGCLFYSPRYALVPEDDPDAELWGVIVVDCAGPSVLHPGEKERSSGLTFRATDMYGDPLPPGDYLAVMDLEERTEHLIEPVTVIAD